MLGAVAAIMASPLAESTVVFRMVNDFENFISKHGKKNQPSLIGNVTRELAFDDSSYACSNYEGNSGGCDSVFSTNSPIASSDAFRQSQLKKRHHEAELITSKSKVSRLESKLSELESSNKLFKIQYEKQVDAIKLEQQNDKEKFDEMRKQLMHKTAKEAESQQELQKLKKLLGTTKMKYEKQINELQKDWTDTKSGLDEQVAQLNEAVFMLERDLHREQFEKGALQSDLESSEVQLQQYSKKSIDVTRYMQEAEKATEEANEARRHIKKLESELTRYEDAGKLIKILEGEVSKMQELESENKHLKESNRILCLREDNVMILIEELDNSRKIIEKLEKQAQALLKYQLENEDLQQEVSAWQRVIVVGRDSHMSPHSVAEAVSQLQRQNTLLLDQVGCLTNDNNSLEKNKISLEGEVKNVKAELENSRIRFKQNSDQIRHLQRKLLLVSKERDVCRDLLDNYSKESTLVSSQLEIDRTLKLETIVEGYKNTVESLESSLNLAREQLIKIGCQSGDEFFKEQDRMKTEMNLLKSKISTYESDIRQLQEEKKLLELRIEYDTIKGEINPLTTRVIHLASNPVSWARQRQTEELELLKKENEVLKQRLKVLEESGPFAEDITIQVEQKLKEAPPTQVLENLQGQLLAAEAKNKRLMEAFKKISNEFREVTCVLLGYNIELPFSSQYKLSNMYAESPDDYLLFSKNENNELHLLETPYSHVLADKIELYLHQNHSIPAFLSNLTLDLFNSQTVIASTIASDITDTTSY